ncbi:MAG: aminotransferase [Thiolinea sp.]
MTTTTLNPYVTRLDTPAIPLALSWSGEYDDSYGPLIDLSQAVPNYAPHSDLLTSLASAAASPESCGYGEIQGEPELRRAYAQYISQLYQAEIQSPQIHITSGCNQAFFTALMAVAGQGNTVLMSNPCYFNHEATARMLGIRLKYFDCDASQGFLPDIRTIEQAIEDSTKQPVKVLALVSPNNPTGAIYPPSLLEQLFQLCKKRGIWLILDETYREFAPGYPALPHTILQQPDWQQNFIQLSSFSKTYCIPGHRLGAVVAGEEVTDAIAKVMDNLQICAPRAAQQALALQMAQLQPWIMKNNQAIAKRAETFRNILAQFPQWQIKSIGGYFAYIQHPYPDMNSANVVKIMASQYGVLPLPGGFFGSNQEQHLRFAFANADEATLHLLLDRLQRIQIS